jgi:hypothetical protein
VAPSRPEEVVVGPLAAVGLLLLGWAMRKRSQLGLGAGLLALALERRWGAYQRFKHDPRFWELNLFMVTRDRSGRLDGPARP